MIICNNKKCNKTIKTNEKFKRIGHGYNYCSDECMIADSKEETIQHSCDHCFNCIEKSESSMFGTNYEYICKLGIVIDFYEKPEHCQQFIYGEPEKKHFSYNTSETTIEEAILFQGEKED